MLKKTKAGILIISLLLVNLARADSITDLTEVYTAEGVPVRVETTPSEFHGLIGAGLFNLEKNIGESSRKTVLLPLIILTYQDWAYWSIGGGGVWLLQSGDRSLKLGVGLKVHRGYSAEDDEVYSGMSDRRRSIDGSINALWKSDIVNTSVNYYHDIGKISKGDSATLKFSHAFSLSPSLRLIPNIGAEWVSARVVDYYYGVSPAESAPTRLVYTGRDTINYNAGLNASYFMSRSWLLLGGVHFMHLGSGIVESPLVPHSNSVLVYLGADWMF
jgi:MipA family protein